MLETRPLLKGCRIHRQDTVAGLDRTEPSLKLSRFRLIALACEFYAGLEFSDSHR